MCFPERIAGPEKFVRERPVVRAEGGSGAGSHLQPSAAGEPVEMREASLEETLPSANRWWKWSKYLLRASARPCGLCRCVEGGAGED